MITPRLVRCSAYRPRIYAPRLARNVFIFLFILHPTKYEAQTLQIPPQPSLVSFAFETLTISTTAIGFTRATIEPTTNINIRAVRAEFSLEGCQVRYRIGSTSPTATVGTLMTTGNGLVLGWDNIRDIKFIRDTSCSVNGTMSVHYYR